MARTRRAAAPPEGAVEIRYDGPTHALEVTSENVTIARGKTAFVSREMAEHLLGCSYADVSVVSEDAPAVWPGTDEKIDALADTLGVTWPEPTNGQGPLTVADKVEYLEATGHSPDGTRQAEVITNPEEQE